jgi:hypothetical protein
MTRASIVACHSGLVGPRQKVRSADLPNRLTLAGFSSHDAQPVTLLKPFNGVRHFLIVQHGNQLRDFPVGMIEP